MNKTRILLLGASLCCHFSIEAADIRVAVTPSQSGVTVCAYSETAGSFQLPAVTAVTNNNGRARFNNLTSGGTYLLIASDGSGRGGVNRAVAVDNPPGNLRTPILLDQDGLQCGSGLVISDFAFEGGDDPEPIGRVGATWSSSPVLDSKVEVCLVEAGSDGTCGACADDDWSQTSNRGDGLKPLFTAYAGIDVPGKHTFCLTQRVAASNVMLVSNTLSDTVTAYFEIEELLINGGDEGSDDTQVSLQWLSDLSVALDSQYRASEDESFQGAIWTDIDHLQDNPGAFVVDDFDLSTGIGLHTVYLQMRLDGQNATSTNIINDQVLLNDPTVDRQVCEINGAELFTFAQNNGWSFETTGFGESECFDPEVVNGELSLAAAPNTACGYELFGGRNLNDGWRFVSMDMDSGAVPEDALIDCLAHPISMPTGEDGSARILINMVAIPWATSLIGADPPSLCRAVISEVVVRGPDGAGCLDGFVEVD